MLAIVSALCLAFAIAACGEENKPQGGGSDEKVEHGEGGHVHIAEYFDVNDLEHWKICAGCNERFSVGKHDFDKYGTCKTCGYSVEYTRGMEYQYRANTDSYFLIGIGEASNESKLIIPAYYEGKAVTRVGYKAFYQNTTLKSVKIGSCVTEIGDHAFYECTSLESITFAENGRLTSIGDDAFRGCSLLESIVLPEGVTLIGDDTFAYCSSLESISLPDSVTSIGRRSFDQTAYYNDANHLDKYGVLYIDNCLIEAKERIDEYTVSPGTRVIADDAFYAQWLLTKITIPESVTSIGYAAFLDCSRLTGVYITDLAAWCMIDFGNGSANPLSCAHHLYLDGNEVKNLTIPSEITEIKDYAFCDCDGLESVTIGSGVTSIGEGAFCDCYELTGELKIPDSVTLIGDSAFSGCSGLSGELKIPDSVTLIGGYAFDGCRRLTSIEIPDSVTSIGKGAFDNCISLQNVYITNIKAWCRIDFGDEYANPLFQGAMLYLNETPIKDLKNHVEITEIKANAFCGYKGFTNLTIPDSVTSIGSDAFRYCSELKSVTIGNGVTSLYDAFRYCSGLTSVTIGSGVTSIGGNAFYCCSGLTSIEIPDSVTSIGAFAFEYCSSLTSITIPEGVTSIGAFAFEGCYKLVEVWDHSGLGIQKGSDGNGCVASRAKYVYKGDEVSKQTVTDDGFIFYEDGEEIYLLGYSGTESAPSLPDKSPSGKNYAIYQYAFYGRDNLTSIEIPDSVTSIGEYAFEGCSRLTSVMIGSGVTSIGAWAFRACDSFKSAIFKNPNGWIAKGTLISISPLMDPATAADFLTDKYLSYYWSRK